ncbi:hypothetical protein AB0D66_00475 [Streptomyces sp. NPDC048270]|uniref:hypothetical protein n=1 Tax=Streptomyces sp. NPDC048270 TaxID=3154615 RepID=UPI0033E39C04
MTHRRIHSRARGVLCIDTPEGLRAGCTAVPEPSAELLDRALVGWERFIGGLEGAGHD